MRKILIFSLSLIFLSLTSCLEETDVWDSSVKDVSGEWFVRYDHSDDPDTGYGEDPYGYGYLKLFTFNTAADDGKEIWITGTDFRVKYKSVIAVNPGSLTFGSDTDVDNTLVNGATVKIINGKVMKAVAVQPSGYVADSIYFEIVFSNLDISGTPDDTLRVGGFRRTGFVEDEH